MNIDKYNRLREAAGEISKNCAETHLGEYCPFVKWGMVCYDKCDCALLRAAPLNWPNPKAESGWTDQEKAAASVLKTVGIASIKKGAECDAPVCLLDADALLLGAVPCSMFPSLGCGKTALVSDIIGEG